MDNKWYMREALEQAKLAMELGEVPIGAVIELDGEIIGRGYNRRNTGKSSLLHAELTAISEACEHLRDWRLDGCRIFVTIEPCPMCAGAIIQARIPEVFFGAKNPKAGCCGSVIDLMSNAGFNHQPIVTAGLLEDECAAQVQSFFRNLRLTLKEERDDKNGMA